MSSRMATVVMFLLGMAVTAAVVLAIVVFTGDGDGGGTAATTATTAATSTEATTTSAPGTTAPGTTAAPPTTAAACAGLPSATIPSLAAPGVTSVAGDFDDDGAMDSLIGYTAGDGTLRVQIALAYGYATEMVVELGPAVAKAAQPFAEGDAWIGIAQVDSGASTEVLQFFQLNGCTIAKSTLDGSGEASFPRGGGVLHMDGITCSATGFTHTSAQSGDGTNWEYYSYSYTWDPVARTFVSAGMASSTLVSPADDEAIFSAAQFLCPFSP